MSSTFTIVPMKEGNPTIVVFCYSWSSDKLPDAFQTALTESFRRNGFNVHIILANYLAETANIGIGKTISQDQVIDYINGVGASLVLSMNHGGLSKKILQGLHCPVVSWIVDALPHMFHTEGVENYQSMFDSKVRVLALSTEIKNDLLKKAPALNGRLSVLAPATQSEAFLDVPSNKSYNISFVGTSLDISGIYRLIYSNLHDEKKMSALSLAIKKLKEDYYLDINQLIQELGLKKELTLMNWDDETFRMMLANLISNNERHQVIEKLHDLGVAVFGNQEWLSSLSSSPKILDSYKGFKMIRSHSELVEVYQTSKISINIPQLQVEASLAYRVLDIMSSGSLLITKYHPESDLFKLFGKDCPVPMYRDIDHLEELCKYYLENENQRVELVQKCNELVSKGFSFDDRVKDILKISNLAIPTGGISGTIHRVPYDFFHSKKFFTKKQFRYFLNFILRKFTNKTIRRKMVNFLQSVDL